MLSALEALLLRPLPYPDPGPAGAGSPDRPAPAATRGGPGELPRLARPRALVRGPRRVRGGGPHAAGARRGAPARHRDRVAAASSTCSEPAPASAAPSASPGTDPARSVLGHALWREQFDADSAVVGRELQLDQELVRVVGVMPPGFGFPREAELWLAAQDGDLPELPDRGGRRPADTPRLALPWRRRAAARGVALAAAQAEMDHVAAALAREYPDANAGQGARVEPLFEALRGGARPAVAAAARRRVLRAARRVRQRGEPVAGPDRRARPGARGARRARGRPRAASRASS